jgi:hypothetical protein
MRISLQAATALLQPRRHNMTPDGGATLSGRDALVILSSFIAKNP